MTIVLDPEESYAYVSRGNVYLKQGKKELAEADFRKVIEIEDSPENTTVYTMPIRVGAE